MTKVRAHTRGAVDPFKAEIDARKAALIAAHEAREAQRQALAARAEAMVQPKRGVFMRVMEAVIERVM